MINFNQLWKFRELATAEDIESKRWKAFEKAWIEAAPHRKKFYKPTELEFLLEYAQIAAQGYQEDDYSSPEEWESAVMRLGETVLSLLNVTSLRRLTRDVDLVESDGPNAIATKQRRRALKDPSALIESTFCHYLRNFGGKLPTRKELNRHCHRICIAERRAVTLATRERKPGDRIEFDGSGWIVLGWRRDCRKTETEDLLLVICPENQWDIPKWAEGEGKKGGYEERMRKAGFWGLEPS